MDCLCAHERGLFWCLFPELREINTKIYIEWASKTFFASMYTLFYLFHDTTNVLMTIKTTIFTHRPFFSPTRFMFWWWRHSRLLMTSQWPDNCNAIKCKWYIARETSISFEVIFAVGRLENICSDAVFLWLIDWSYVHDPKSKYVNEKHTLM